MSNQYIFKKENVVINPITNRRIKKGSRIYNNLLSRRVIDSDGRLLISNNKLDILKNNRIKCITHTVGRPDNISIPNKAEIQTMIDDQKEVDLKDNTELSDHESDEDVTPTIEEISQASKIVLKEKKEYLNNLDSSCNIDEEIRKLILLEINK